MADTLGWIANIFFVSGTYLLSKRKAYGFYCNIIANVIYVFVGLYFKITSLIGISILLVLINSYAIYNWRNNK